jgi:hypothetical protein
MRGNSHKYKDACSLAQEKGPASLIYHEPALEVRFVRRAADTTSFLTIRDIWGRTKTPPSRLAPAKNSRSTVKGGNDKVSNKRTLLSCFSSRL